MLLKITGHILVLPPSYVLPEAIQAAQYSYNNKFSKSDEALLILHNIGTNPNSDYSFTKRLFIFKQ